MKREAPLQNREFYIHRLCLPLDIGQEILVASDIVGLVVRRRGRDAQDGALRHPKHTVSAFRFDDQALGGLVQQHRLLADAIVQRDPDLTVGTEQKLARLLMRMMPALEADRHVGNRIDALDGKADVASLLKKRKLSH